MSSPTAAPATSSGGPPTVVISTTPPPTVGADGNPTGDAPSPSLMCDPFSPTLAQAFVDALPVRVVDRSGRERRHEWREGDAYGDLTFSSEINARETAQQYVDAANARSGGLSSRPVVDLGDNAVSIVYTEAVLSGNGTSVSTGVVWARGTDLYVLQYHAESEQSDRSAELTPVAQGINRALG